MIENDFTYIWVYEYLIWHCKESLEYFQYLEFLGVLKSSGVRKLLPVLRARIVKKLSHRVRNCLWRRLHFWHSTQNILRLKPLAWCYQIIKILNKNKHEYQTSQQTSTQNSVCLEIAFMILKKYKFKIAFVYHLFVFVHNKFK